MISQLAIVLSLLGVCVALFIANKPRVDVVALMAMVALPLTGVITVPETLAGFSDPNVILIAALFVVGDGLVRTGVVNQIGDFLHRRAGGSEGKLICLLMLATAGLGSIMSSTGVVAIFIPVTLFIAGRQKVSPSRLMMPLCFGGLISGMITLVGTPPNLVIDSALQHAGFAGFAFFSITPFGIVVLALGIAYMLVTRRWLDRGEEPERPLRERPRLMDFVKDYQLADREHRLKIGASSPLTGQSLGALERHGHSASLLAVERKIGRRRELIGPRPDLQLHEGDVLFVDAASEEHLNREEVMAELKLEALPLRGHYFTDQSRDLGMAEVLLPPESALVGNTVRDASFRPTYNLTVIGLRRKRAAVTGDVAGEKLKAGDTLLVIGGWKQIRELRNQTRDFLVLSLPAELDTVAPAASRAPYAVASLAVMVTLMVTGWVPNVIAVLLTCLLMGVAGCIKLSRVYKSIQWPSLMVIIGMMPFSIALQKTGGVDLAVDGLLRVFGESEPRVLLGALFVATALISLFVSNTATAVLMAPIALKLASALHASPYPFAMTVALASSAAFMTPVSSPVNTLVLVPGKYRFIDFVRVGVPFTIVVLIITVLLVPWLMPLRP